VWNATSTASISSYKTVAYSPSGVNVQHTRRAWLEFDSGKKGRVGFGTALIAYQTARPSVSSGCRLPQRSVCCTVHRSTFQSFCSVRLAVLSDIHANLHALQAALRIVEQADVEAIYCLGDIVGYNADPGPCVDLVREHCTYVVQGNHDRAVATGAGMEQLPLDAQRAATHHRSVLNEEQLAFLRALPLVDTVGPCTLVHASPDAPDSWKHLSAYQDIRTQFEHFDTPFCFTGHTHIPAVIADALGVFEVRAGHRYLINVGSVGQPRDHTSKGSLVLFDTEALIHRCVRFSYDVEAAAARIEAEQLPVRLAKRLRDGQ